MAKIPLIFFWSGGKDSAYALDEIRNAGQYEVRYLLSTFNGEYKRLSMHGVREGLIQRQAEQMGIALRRVYVFTDSNAEYEEKIMSALQDLRSEGISTVAFGDIFLEDLRPYREKQMLAAGMDCIFPLWKKNTTELVQDFIKRGFVSHCCCVNDAFLGRQWAGRKIDEGFIAELPEGVDPCGENGEYHSFCSEGPIFRSPVRFTPGEVIYRPLEIKTSASSSTGGFWYCDFICV
jgi:uncharacterized protein (TIGR00290 family)